MIGIIVVAITLVLALPAAYVLARLTGRWGQRLGIAIFLTYLIPPTFARDEIFGPVLSAIRADNIGEALSIINRSMLGNAASIFTRSGDAVRKFRTQVEAGMVGINIGVAAPMAFFPFAG